MMILAATAILSGSFGGLIAWLLMRRPKRRIDQAIKPPAAVPDCGESYCKSTADPRCGATLCSRHCHIWCPRDCRAQPRLRSIPGGRK